MIAVTGGLEAHPTIQHRNVSQHRCAEHIPLCIFGWSVDGRSWESVETERARTQPKLMLVSHFRERAVSQLISLLVVCSTDQSRRYREHMLV